MLDRCEKKNFEIMKKRCRAAVAILHIAGQLEVWRAQAHPTPVEDTVHFHALQAEILPQLQDPKQHSLCLLLWMPLSLMTMTRPPLQTAAAMTPHPSAGKGAGHSQDMRDQSVFALNNGLWNHPVMSMLQEAKRKKRLLRVTFRLMQCRPRGSFVLQKKTKKVAAAVTCKKSTVPASASLTRSLAPFSTRCCTLFDAIIEAHH